MKTDNNDEREPNFWPSHDQLGDLNLTWQLCGLSEAARVGGIGGDLRTAFGLGTLSRGLFVVFWCGHRCAMTEDAFTHTKKLGLTRTSDRCYKYSSSRDSMICRTATPLAFNSISCTSL